MGKKQEVLLELFRLCQQRGQYVFDNDMVEAVCRRIGFKNKFDATKLDNISLLPAELRALDYAVIHKGRGQHEFTRGIEKIYHRFEPISEQIEWPYRKSLLNEYNTSESNMLSVANNQRILHHFLFGVDREFDNVDISERPKTYFPHRTKADLTYQIGDYSRQIHNLKVGLCIEYKGKISIFQKVIGLPDSFLRYKAYLQFLYYEKMKAKHRLDEYIKNVIVVYISWHKTKTFSEIKLWAYTFINSQDANSISLQKSTAYQLLST